MKLRFRNTNYFWDTDKWELWSDKSKKYKKASKDNNGYLKYGIYIDGKPIYIRQHTIIAELLIPNPNNLPCVDHINTIRDDNRLENLRWVSVKGNVNNPLSISKMSSSKLGKIGKLHNKAKKISQYTKDGRLINNYGSIIDVERDLGINHRSISACARGKRKTAGGFVWRY